MLTIEKTRTIEVSEDKTLEQLQVLSDTNIDTTYQDDFDLIEQKIDLIIPSLQTSRLLRDLVFKLFEIKGIILWYKIAKTNDLNTSITQWTQISARIKSDLKEIYEQAKSRLLQVESNQTTPDARKQIVVSIQEYIKDI